MNTSSKLKVATPTDTTIVMTRTFNVPRKLVWQAMTDPDKLRRWMFSPPGWKMTTCQGDLRVGGTYRWEWHDEHGQPALLIHGVNKEVVPFERIVHTEIMEMGCHGPVGELLAAIDLTEKNGVTEMRMTLTFDSKEARDGALASGMEHGMEAGYTQLDAAFAAGE